MDNSSIPTILQYEQMSAYNKEPEVQARFKAITDFLKENGFIRHGTWYLKEFNNRVSYMGEYFWFIEVQPWAYDLVSIKVKGFISEPEEEVVFRGEIFSIDQLELILKLTTGWTKETNTSE